MSKETEKFFKEFSLFAEGLDLESEDDLNEALQTYVSKYNAEIMGKQIRNSPQTADDYLELVEEAVNQKEALKYAKKALSLEPENIDAQTAVALNSASTIEAALEKMKVVYLTSTEYMKQHGYFDADNIGEFWLIHETRPYMRMLDTYAQTLYNCGKLKLAAEILCEMIRLCENDNLAARYTLMHIYALLEDEQSALKLLEKYKDDNSVQFLLPLSLLYFKLDDLKKSATYLRKIKNTNPDAVDFFEGIVNGNFDEFIDAEDTSSFGYRPYTMDELLIELEHHKMMLFSVPAYFEWAYRKIKRNTKKNNSSNSKRLEK